MTIASTTRPNPDRGPNSRTRHLPPARTTVVIVGAGPTGLSLGCALAQDGIDFILLDRAAKGANTSRAAVVHARTLEVLQPLGITPRLIDEGLVVPRFSVRDRDGVLNSVSFSSLPTAYPFTLMIPQSRTEEILRARLAELGGHVEWQTQVEEVTETQNGCVVRASTADGQEFEILTRYVVGADGMHSKVREKADIAFEGDSYARPFVLADVEMDWPLPDSEVELFLSPHGLMVVAPLPGQHYRIVATLDDAPATPEKGDIQRILDTRGPRRNAAKVTNAIWSSRFHVHHRLAERFVSGRVLLAGDSAHVHSPAGGQGMNTGIQDAIAAAAALGEIVKSDGDEAAASMALQRYATERRRIAKRVVALTDLMTRAALLRASSARRIRNLVVRAIASIPALRHRMALELSELRNRPIQEAPHSAGLRLHSDM